MAIRTFNSVGGFSVGETPETIILANGDITTDFATFTANVSAGNILSDHLLHANGVAWDFVTAGGSNTQLQFNDGGDLGGTSNLTYDKGTNTLTLTGTANIGNVTTSNVISSGNITAQYFIGDVIGNISGTITVPGHNTAVLFNQTGNAGASDALKFNYSSNVLTLTGNLNAYNANLGNLTVANYFSGDGSLLTNINGNEVSEVATANYAVYSNLAFYIGGTGVMGNVAESVHSYYADTANAIAGSGVSGNVSQAVHAYFADTANAVTGGNVTGNVAQAVHAYFADTANAVTGGNVTGNVAQAVHAYYADTANAVAGANVSGNVSQSIHSFYSDTANAVSGGNVSGQVANALVAGTVYTNAQPNITSVGTLSSLDVSANIQGGNLIANTALYTPNITNGSTGLTIDGGYPGFVQFYNGGGNTVKIDDAGNIDGGNANLTGTVIVGNLQVTSKVTSNLIPSTNNTYHLGNTSLGWAELNVTNINIGTTYIRSSGSNLQFESANATGTVSANAIVSRGDATMQANLTVNGNLVVGGTTTYVNSTNTSVKDPLIDLGGSDNGGNIVNYDGKDRGLVLHNYYSNGFSAVNQFMGWDTSNGEFSLGSNVSVSGEVITFNQFANIRGDSFIGNLVGTVSTASQPNITSLGVLSSLTISGNLQVNTNANLNSLTAGGLSYPTSDGSAGQVMTTYGNGVVYFKTISTSSLTNGTSNVSVVNNGNVNISSSGVANVVVVTNTGANINGTLNSTGAATVGSVIVGDTSVGANSKTTTSTAKASIVSFATTGKRAVEFFVKGEESAGGKYSVATVSAVHDSTGNIDYSVYGTVILGGATGVLEVNIDLSGNISLDVTPASSNSTVWTVQYRTI